MKHSTNKVRIILIIYMLIVACLSFVLLDQLILQCLFMLFFIIVAILLVLNILKIDGFPEIISSILLVSGPAIVKFLSDTTFAEKITPLYANATTFICIECLGRQNSPEITNEISIAITIFICLLIILFCNLFFKKDTTAMKKVHGKPPKELTEKTYSERSHDFCQVLRERLHAIERDSNWNDKLYTPIEAEIEVETNGKYKKRYDDLLKCLKKVKRGGTIFLVLGDPGSGKSVSLRKLCLELLDEFDKTQKIPVYINLKEWKRAWSVDDLPTQKDLIDFIKEQLYNEGKNDYFTDTYLDDYFDTMMAHGRWYYIFDSFDELPCLMGKDNCQELIHKLSELLYSFMNGANQTGGIIASRLYKNPSQALGASVTLRIQEFDDFRINLMLKKYFRNATEISKELFRKHEHLVALCRNPFYLNLLINYINTNGLSFPKNQIELYDSFIKERFQKCEERLHTNHIQSEELYSAAEQLASLIHQAGEQKGFEYSVSTLLQNKNSYKWDKYIETLKYAKICKLSDDKTTISFVHRRFQEFFLVQHMMHTTQTFTQKDYKDIINNPALRDAFVLYAEVAPENQAREIAEACWEIVKNNIGSIHSIWAKGVIDLVNALYFLTDAFRNRKEAISSFQNDFFVLFDNILDNEIQNRNSQPKTTIQVLFSFVSKTLCYSSVDDIVLQAMVNSFVLFDETMLKNIVLKIFKLHNRWLNDIIMQNFRSIKKLDKDLEKNFVSYFSHFNVIAFIKQFHGIQFSLSTSSGFKFIKRTHFLLYLYYLTIFFNGIYFICITFCTLFTASFSVSPLFTILFSFLHFSILIYSIYTMELYFISFVFILQSSCILNVATNATFAFSLIILFLYSVSLFFYNLHFFIQYPNIKQFFTNIFDGIKDNLSLIIADIFFVIVIPVLAHKFLQIYIMYLEKVVLIFICIIAILLFFILVCYIAVFSIDILYLQKQPHVQIISRTHVVSILHHLRLNRSRLIFLKYLKRRKIELLGDWPNKQRPYLANGNLDHLLAELDNSDKKLQTRFF